MPAPPPPASRLLVIAAPSEAAALVERLREDGLEIEGSNTQHPEGIAALLARDPCDLILCCAYDPGVDLDAVLTHHRGLTGDVPLIVVADPGGAPRALSWVMQQGARDLAERGDDLRLRLIVQRELADLAARRQLRALIERLGGQEAPDTQAAEPREEAVALIQDGMHADANSAYLRLFGFPTADDVHSAALLDLIAAESHGAVRDWLRDRRSGTPHDDAQLKVTCIRTDGSRFPATLVAAPAEVDGEPGLRLTVLPLNIQAPAPVRPEPNGAPRGGLPGYAELIAALAAELGPEHRPARPFALFYIAIRTSPTLFGDLGLSRGLVVIGDLAAALARVCGPLGPPARLNVDGYGLLAPGLDETDAADLAGRIRTQVRLPPDTEGASAIAATCDLGYVFVTSGPCADPAALLDAAYRACHGRSAVPVRPVSPQKATLLAARTRQDAEDGDQLMIEQVREALDNGRLLLVYQPIVSLMGETQENFSVLLRLIDRSGDLIEAQRFIGPAIRAGLIQALDRWVVRTTIAALAEQRRSGRAVNFFVNLAEDSFRDRDIQFWIRDYLREFGIHASWLTLIIQENLIETDAASLGPVVERLKTLGCRIAVSRFGATDHSEQLLTGLLPDLVLLLPDYAKGLAEDPAKQQRLTMLISAAHQAHIKTVVTGVEDASSLTILWTAGVDYVQGNFLQRPSPQLEVTG